ncbi:MAG: hypothetical protein ACYDGR_06430 [Candidatus Dormibacteria bacterium]
MPKGLRPAKARYSFLHPDGTRAGGEELRLAPTREGWVVTSVLHTDRPSALRAELEWHLLEDLTTRILYITSESSLGEHRDLELAVSGNGLLCHRVAPDGPTQVELGWGPSVELDYLSAAFPTILAARSRRGDRPHAAVVLVTAEDLLPEPQEHSYRWSGPDCLVLDVAATGYRAEIALEPSGMLRTYGDLLRLDQVELAATK